MCLALADAYSHCGQAARTSAWFADVTPRGGVAGRAVEAVPPPDPDEVKVLGFYRDRAEEAKETAKAYLELSDPTN